MARDFKTISPNIDIAAGDIFRKNASTVVSNTLTSTYSL